MEQTKHGRKLRIALAVSVGLNLAVAGLAVGALLHGPHPRDQMSRDLGFGPFSEALSPSDRRALRAVLLEKSPELRGAMRQRRADLSDLLTALRAQPFDPAAMTAALDATRNRLQSQLALGQDSLIDVLMAMPQEERLKFADRLERGQRRGGNAARSEGDR